MVKKSISEKQNLSYSEEKKSYKPIIIIFIIAAVLIPVTVYAVMYITEIRTKASPTEKPQKIEITNISDSSINISWITQTKKTIGLVKYGASTKLTNTAFDIRDTKDTNGEYFNHYVELTNLSASTTYYYTIVVGGKEYKKENEDYSNFKTGSTLSTIPTPLPIKGKVADPSSGNEEIIVYIYLENDRNISSKLSALTSSRQYVLDLANLRTSDLSETYTLLDGATIYVLAQGGDRGEGSVTTKVIESED